MATRMEDVISIVTHDEMDPEMANVVTSNVTVTTDSTQAVLGDTTSSGNMQTDERCKQMLKSYCRKGH